MTGRSEERVISNDSTRHSKMSSSEMKSMRVPSAARGGRQAAIRAKSKIISNRNTNGIS